MAPLYIPVKEYTPAPTGTHLAVCTKVEEKMVPSRFAEKGEALVVQVTWELLNARRDDGERHAVSRLYNYTWGASTKPSNLRNLVDGWLEKAHTNAEFKTFDVYTLIGRRALVQVIHKVKDDGTFARVNTVLPEPKAPDVPLEAKEWTDDEEDEEEGKDEVPF